MEYANPAALVETDWVADNINSPTLRLLMPAITCRMWIGTQMPNISTIIFPVPCALISTM